MLQFETLESQSLVHLGVEGRQDCTWFFLESINVQLHWLIGVAHAIQIFMSWTSTPMSTFTKDSLKSAIWARIPTHVMKRGHCVGWFKIKSTCTKFLTNQTPQETDVCKKLKVNNDQDTDPDMDWIVVVCLFVLPIAIAMSSIRRRFLIEKRDSDLIYV